MVQEWQTAVENALCIAFKECKEKDGEYDLAHAVALLCWGAMRAQRNCPEWAMATLMKRLEDEPMIDELAAMFILNTPIERMAI